MTFEAATVLSNANAARRAMGVAELIPAEQRQHEAEQRFARAGRRAHGSHNGPKQRCGGCGWIVTNANAPCTRGCGWQGDILGYGS